MKENKLSPIHPGEILNEEFLKPMDINPNRLAQDIGVPANLINEIIHGEHNITANIALRLGRYFGISPQFWLGLQMDYDLEITEDELAGMLDSQVRVRVGVK